MLKYFAIYLEVPQHFKIYYENLKGFWDSGMRLQLLQRLQLQSLMFNTDRFLNLTQIETGFVIYFMTI
jgi:hypothetical protein